MTDNCKNPSTEPEPVDNPPAYEFKENLREHYQNERIVEKRREDERKRPQTA